MEGISHLMIVLLCDKQNIHISKINYMCVTLINAIEQPLKSIVSTINFHAILWSTSFKGIWLHIEAYTVRPLHTNKTSIQVNRDKRQKFVEIFFLLMSGNLIYKLMSFICCSIKLGSDNAKGESKPKQAKTSDE